MAIEYLGLSSLNGPLAAWKAFPEPPMMRSWK